jgi:uncharacterized protein (DUF58 family)
MKDALRGLTFRGRAFLGAGVAAVVCGIVLDQRGLVRVGVLVIALPLVVAWTIGRGRYRLSLQRTVTPEVVAAGQPAHAKLTISNDGLMPIGSLLLEEALPYQLGSRPRFVVSRMRRGWGHNVVYQLRSDLRGRFTVGPMSVRLADPFGLVELDRTFAGTARLLVTPRIEPLTPVTLPGGRSTTGDVRPRAFATGSAEDVTVREYVRGDDLRRVHWRSSARVGELMVRREEQPWQARATVLLDDRASAHRGTGAASSFEAAVTGAASLVAHLEQRGYTTRLATTSGSVSTDSAAVDRRAVIATMMEQLAGATLTEGTVIDPAWLRDGGSGSLTVALLGAVEEADLGVLRRVLHHAGKGWAIALDVAAWGKGPEAMPGSAVAGAGWKAAVLGPRDRIDDAWRQFGTGTPRYGQTGVSA